MANRTVKLLGYGFGSTPANVTATFNGNVVYSGDITTADIPVPTLPDLSLVNDPVPIVTFDIPDNEFGSFPTSILVNNGSIIVAGTQMNYPVVANSVYTQNDLDVIFNPASTREQIVLIFELRANPALSPADITILNSTDPADVPAQNLILRDHGLASTVQGGANDWSETSALSGQIKQNVTINGVAPTELTAGDTTGELWYVVPQGSTIAFDWRIDLLALVP